MSLKRTIECIGASDEDIAHIRLLLRSSTIHLRDIWRFGEEDKAELIVVDRRSLIGDSAFRRTQTRGIACACLIEADDPAPEGRCLRKPLRREDFVSLLNGIGGSTVAPLSIVAQGDDFFNMDLGEPDFSDIEQITGALALEAAEIRDEELGEHETFEEMFRRDPLAAKPQFLMPEKLAENLSVEYVRTTTTRSASRADAGRNPFALPGLDQSLIDPSFRHDLDLREEDNATYPLLEYLNSNLLGGPARIALPGAQPLVLDPKEKVFHAEGRLPAMQPYFEKPLRLGDWRRLVVSELMVLRERIPAKPYRRLIWMERFIHSDGYLSKHLDPAGSYRLTRWLELAQDYPRAFIVGANMITPLRLHEIARVSEVDLAQVFDVVNAYEAIGFIEWTHRQRA